ncbi:hypothetical protein ACULNC_17945 [Shigella flexneri]
MKKTLLAIMLAGTAFASQAGTLVSQGTEASANLTLTKPIVVNNTIQPVKGVYSGTLTAWTPWQQVLLAHLMGRATTML